MFVLSIIIDILTFIESAYKESACSTVPFFFFLLSIFELFADDLINFWLGSWNFFQPSLKLQDRRSYVVVSEQGMLCLDKGMRSTECHLFIYLFIFPCMPFKGTVCRI